MFHNQLFIVNDHYCVSTKALPKGNRHKTYSYTDKLLMQPGKTNNSADKSMEEQGKHEHSLPHEISSEQKRINEAAHDEAEHDIDEDPDLSIHIPK
jgi:hypothetical protein